jgi:hypothetical protein
MSFRSEQDPGANMMRGIYLAVASIIPTGMYGMANWHAAEGVSRGFITGENCRCRDGEPTAGHKCPGFRAIMVTGMDVTAAQVKNKISRTLQPGRSRRPIQNSARDLRFFR